jgi:hypothetical protein
VTEQDSGLGGIVTALEMKEALSAEAFATGLGFRAGTPSGASAPTGHADNVCALCKVPPPPGKRMKKCARCLKVPYCSADCQKKAWKDHKRVCAA